jgi:hypothetical protein
MLESDTILLVLRNLLKAAHEREERGEPPPQPPPQAKGRGSAVAVSHAK